MENIKIKKADWTAELTELENYFNSVPLPKMFVLNKWSTSSNLKSTIDANLSIAKRNNGNKVFLPYLERLRIIKNKLENGMDSTKNT